MLSPRQYIKQSWEEETIDIDFSERIAVGDSISSVLSKMEDANGVDVTVSMISSSTVTSPHIYIALKNGEDGKRYNLGIKVTLSSGQKKEEDLVVVIKNIGKL